MLELLVSPKVRQDLAEIYQYTFEEWSLYQADNYQDDLFHGMHLILPSPDLGKRYEYHDRVYTKLHINRHLIFYRVESNQCQCIVVRVLHDRMDIKGQFGE